MLQSFTLTAIQRQCGALPLYCFVLWLTIIIFPPLDCRINRASGCSLIQQRLCILKKHPKLLSEWMNFTLVLGEIMTKLNMSGLQSKKKKSHFLLLPLQVNAALLCRLIESKLVFQKVCFPL